VSKLKLRDRVATLCPHRWCGASLHLPPYYVVL